MLNWTGLGSASEIEVDSCFIFPIATFNTGLLADLDKITTADIDPNSVTDILSTHVASLTTSSLAQDVATVSVPAQSHAYTAVVIASCNHWENTRQIPTGPPAWTLRLDRDGSPIVTQIVLNPDGVDTAAPGSRYALQFDWDVPASVTEHFRLHWQGATLGDRANFQDIELTVIVTLR